jgi:hypothetical protein
MVAWEVLRVAASVLRSSHFGKTLFTQNTQWRILKQESDCSQPRQQARHENSSDFKTQAHSCTCFFCFHQTGTEVAASYSVAEVPGTGVCYFVVMCR